jgi:tripartite ATP-independent transporter DctP family solute receptor
LSHRLARRSVFAGAASGVAAVCLLRYPASAAEFTYKLATTVPTAHPLTSRALEAAARIGRESGGRMELQVFPNSVLGADDAMLQQLRIGALEFYQCGHPPLSSFVPATGLDGLPFIFSTYDEAWRASDGALGNYIRAQIAKAGLQPVGKTWDSSLRQFENNSRAVNTPDDLKGLKLRVVPGAVPIALLRAFGATPTPMAYREVYTALQSKLIDGIDVPFNAVDASTFYEVVRYASRTNHSWTGITMLASPDPWQHLPARLRDIVERNFDISATQQRQDTKNDDNGYSKGLPDKGMTYNVANHASFQAAVRKAGLYGQWRTAFGDEAWRAVEKSVGTLA